MTLSQSANLWRCLNCATVNFLCSALLCHFYWNNASVNINKKDKINKTEDIDISNLLCMAKVQTQLKCGWKQNRDIKIVILYFALSVTPMLCWEFCITYLFSYLCFWTGCLSKWGKCWRTQIQTFMEQSPQDIQSQTSDCWKRLSLHGSYDGRCYLCCVGFNLRHGHESEPDTCYSSTRKTTQITNYFSNTTVFTFQVAASLQIKRCILNLSSNATNIYFVLHTTVT